MKTVEIEQRNNARQVGVRFKKIGPEIVEDLEVNPFLRDILQTNDSRWFSPEFYLAMAGLTVSGKKFDRVIPTATTSGRLVVVGNVSVAYGPFFHGRILTIKGCGPSGSYYNNDEITGQKWPSSPNTHIGLFGYCDARKELNISNLLLEYNVRAAPVLAIAQLNQSRLRSFLSSHNNHSQEYSLLTIDQLEKLLSHSQAPCLLFRLGTTSNRLEYTDPNTITHSLAIGARNLLKEHSINDALFTAWYTEGLEIESLLATLGKIASYKRISRDEFDTIGLLLSNIGSHQDQQLTLLNTKHPNNLDVSDKISLPKDVDFGIYSTDLGEETLNQPPKNREVNRSLEFATLTYMEYLRLYLQHSPYTTFLDNHRMHKSSQMRTSSRNGTYPNGFYGLPGSQ